MIWFRYSLHLLHASGAHPCCTKIQRREKCRVISIWLFLYLLSYSFLQGCCTQRIQDSKIFQAPSAPICSDPDRITSLSGYLSSVFGINRGKDYLPDPSGKIPWMQRKMMQNSWSWTRSLAKRNWLLVWTLGNVGTSQRARGTGAHTGTKLNNYSNFRAVLPCVPAIKVQFFLQKSDPWHSGTIDKTWSIMFFPPLHISKEGMFQVMDHTGRGIITEERPGAPRSSGSSEPACLNLWTKLQVQWAGVPRKEQHPKYFQTWDSHLLRFWFGVFTHSSWT